MKKKHTPVQEEKFSAGKRYFKESQDAESLYTLVVIVGPTLVGSLIQSNSDTVWNRIRYPGTFKFSEMKALSNAFEVSIEELQNRIERQTEFNRIELKSGRRIGKERYKALLK